MINHDIQARCDLIKVSLTADEQEDLSVKQQQLIQVLKNTLNSARSRQAALEQAANVWQAYKKLFHDIETIVNKLAFPDEPVTTLSGLLSHIQKLIASINDIHVIYYNDIFCYLSG